MSAPQATQSKSADLPPLTTEGTHILREVQKEVQKRLSEQRIDTSFGPRPVEDSDRPSVKEHEQNARNRKREDDFMRQNELWVPLSVPLGAIR